MTMSPVQKQELTRPADSASGLRVYCMYTPVRLSLRKEQDRLRTLSCFKCKIL
jgi:hypothetical protein